MQTLLTLNHPESDIRARSGFRLQHFEVLNWGTFDQYPWRLDLQGGIALLTGANGSGKSTLVDGLLTLIVPNKRRNYNQASSQSGKKERNEKSYLQGAYGRTRAEDYHGSKPKLLREKNPLSVLLANFRDYRSEQSVTLGQVLWLEEGTVRKFFLIADCDLSIMPHFENVTNIPDLKKKLKTLDVTLFDQFTKYSQQFRKRFGLQSEKALDLFNQTVSIKEIGSLNEFVRNHMLEKLDVQAKIQELQETCSHLTFSYTAIQNARKQLEALLPLTEEAQKYAQLQQAVSELQHLQQLAPAFFARRKLDLLQQEQKELAQELAKLNNQLAASDRRLESLRQQETALEVAIKQDEVGQQLKELDRAIEQCQQEVKRKDKQANQYEELAERLGLEKYRDRDTFYHNRTQGERLKQEILSALHALQQQRDEQKLRYADLEKKQKQLDEELTSLRSRKNQIPKANLVIRDRVAQDLNLTEQDLPFVGELLQVRPEAQDWEGAIERLLRGFGLCVLVPDFAYAAVNQYVNQTHLRGRLVYFRVTDTIPNPNQRPFSPDQVPYRLEIQQDNAEFAEWLRERLSRQFNYVCCDTIEEFQREHRAITRTGLLKHGGEKHEKDDRAKINDRSQYILGWNNASKIAALEADLAQINQELSQIAQEIQQLERQQSQRSRQESWLQDFMRFEDFAEIDWRSRQIEQVNLQKQRQELEASSDHLQKLEQQLQERRVEIQQESKQRDRVIGEIKLRENRLQQSQIEQHQCKSQLESFIDADIDYFGQQMSAILQRKTLSLATIDQDEQQVRDSLREKLGQRERHQGDSRSSLNMRMLNFKNAFPETASELGTSLDYLEEYLKLQIQIEQDDLPRHEQRFKQLMNEKVVIGISMFKTALDKQEEDIKQAIDELNISLQKIDYTDSTYIRLCCDPTRHREIRDFRQDLKSCLADVGQQTEEANEALFHNIQTLLIDRFKSEERWTYFVTDVRNWLDFSVSERYRFDDSEKEHHTDSSGKSGGQKVKLAYTILASAIAYQFGLHQDKPNHKSFRFVVIDEAFSKSDDSNARYAMELFKNLDLQLLVITPKDKINVIESYIDSLHFVSNTPAGDCSKIASIAIEKYRQECQSVLLH